MAVTPRLRFAPSPTGFLHVGGARTALFNWLYARRFGGQFLLRIEDTDRARSTDESTRAIFDGLEWLGLAWDEPPVYQGASVERHRADVARLVAAGHAYRDFMPHEELQRRRAEQEARGEQFRFQREWAERPFAEQERRAAAGEPHVVRFRTPDDGVTAWDDLVHGRIAFPNKDVGEGDFIVLRSDGTPIYNMAVVSDDIAMGITLVMRGDDHISNTPKQILLTRRSAPGAAVRPPADDPRHRRQEAVEAPRRHGGGRLPAPRHPPRGDAQLPRPARLEPGGDREVMTVDEMVALFGPDGLLKKAAVFDPQKLEWMNAQHLMRMPPDALAALVAPAVEAAGLARAAELLGARRAWFDLLLEQLRVRSRTIDDVARQAAVYLRDDVAYDDDAVAKHWRKDPAQARALLAAARDSLAGLARGTRPRWSRRCAASPTRAAWARGKLFQPLRVALVGRHGQPRACSTCSRCSAASARWPASTLHCAHPG
jgi:glutamyl-tRNA synthetase